MSDLAVRELTARELIEQSDCKEKELILNRLKEEQCRYANMIDSLEEERNYLERLTDSYRMVIKDIVRRVIG